jgi:two-component system response regulator NreC
MPKFILIADDNPMVRATLQNLLEAQDHWKVVAQAEDGLDAVRKTDELKPDIVVLDISMPQMNGIDATRELRQRYPLLPIVIFTSHSGDTMKTAGFSAGANAVVTKSEPSTLVGQIHQLLGTVAA